MHEIHVADSCGANGNCRASAHSQEYTGDQDSSPGSTVPSHDVTDIGEEVPEEVNWPTTIYIRKLCDEQWPYTGEYEVDRQFIRGFNWAVLEFLSQLHKGRVDDSSAHGS